MSTIVRHLTPFFICLLLVCISSKASAETTTAASYAGGDGTSGSPYQISNLAELRLLSETTADWVSGKYFVLTADIDATDTNTWNVGDHDNAGGTADEAMGFNPIGDNLSTNSFSASIDGQKHKITNLFINRPKESFVALIAATGFGSSIQNLGIEGGEIIGRTDVGGLVGYSNFTTITACFSTATISGYWGIGGLIGGSTSSPITSCYSTGAVSASGNYAGGLVGSIEVGSIDTCYAAGPVSAIDNVGGLVGFIFSGGTVTSSYWDTQTSGQATSAGGTGLTTAQMMAQASYDANWDFTTAPEWLIDEGLTYPFLFWTRYSGGTGIAADPYQISTLDELWRLSDTLDDWAADIHFSLTNDIDASDTSTWNGGLGFSPIGSIFNRFQGAFDGQGFIISDLAINRPAQEDVGLFGFTGTGSSINNIGIDGGTIAGGFYVGGLVGSSNSTITSCFSTATVSGQSNYIGGLVGYKYTGSINASYALGAVSGSSFVGGLVGSQGGGTIDACYSAGAVSAPSSVGGLVGTNSGTVTSSYWNTETSNRATSAGGTGLTSAAMLLQSSFTGFDFTTNPDWIIANGGTYPYLPWQETPAASQYAGGIGTMGDPYQIDSLNGLRLLSETSADWGTSTFFVLTADIDASNTSSWNDGAGFLPIGDAVPKFGGSFDGQGYSISNLYPGFPIWKTDL